MNEKYPQKDKDGCLIFEDYPEFRPNLTPREIIESHAWCGGYFRRVYSTIAKHYLKEDDYKKYPFLKDLPAELMTKNIDEYHDHSFNKYHIHASLPLIYWEQSGWIKSPDYRGQFQWYCEFYNGRRIPEIDKYQIKRWLNLTGPKGRFKSSLLRQIHESGKKWDDPTVAPRIRQTLLHWGYEITKKDYNDYVKRI